MTDSGTFEGTTQESSDEEPGGILAERLAGVAALLSGDAPPEDETTEEAVADDAISETADAVGDEVDTVDANGDADEAEVETEEASETGAAEVTETETEAGADTAEEGSADDDEEEEAEEILPPASPYDLPGSWYVVHSYSGYENKVKANLGTRIKSMHMEDSIFDIVIPMEDVVEIKSGRRMYMDDDSWGVVRNTPGVTGFVGSGTKPTPLSRREVERILGVRKDEEKKAPRFKPDWEVGETVRVLDGPFADFNGVIEDINVDQSKVRVLVDIFGRETPVELNFEQIQKF
jgi:transcriptional antiterminator NusG